MVSTATSTPNMVGFSTTTVDHAAAETQYTGEWLCQGCWLIFPLFKLIMIFVQALSSGSLSLRIITSQSSPSCSTPSLPTSTSGELRMTNQFRPIQTCSRLLVHCAPTVAGRFHKRHLATFLGNPEFKLFIQQLAEVGMLYRFFLYLFPGQLGRFRQGFRHMLW